MAWRDAWSGLAHRPARPARSPDDELAVAGLARRHATAVEHYHAGRVEAAVPLLEQILLGCRAVLGDRHPDTLTVEGNLAVVYLVAGRTDEGLDALEAVHELRRRTFGDDDPRTLTAQDCLATAYRTSGRTDAAVRLAEAVVAARERILGAAHPDTLTSRLGLGLAHAEADAPGQASAVLAVGLRDADEADGSTSRHAIAMRAALACCHALSGDLVAATAEYDRAIVDSVALLGADHPDTVSLLAERDEITQR